MEKTDLQIAVEAELGVELCPVFFADAEQYARRKLEVANRSAGREWGEDGYGDEYLVLLIPDVIREMAFSAYWKRTKYSRSATKRIAWNGFVCKGPP